MKNNLLILGMGQYGNIAKDIAEVSGCFDKIDFLDDNNDSAIGKIYDLENFSHNYKWAIVAIGNASKRKELLDLLRKKGFKIATLIHPSAIISQYSKVNDGCIIEPYAIVNPECVIGKGTYICAGSIVNHNSVIGDFCHLDVGCIVSSNTKVQDNTNIECGVIYK